MSDVLIDSLLDSALVLPFLFAVYLLIEILEHNLMFANRTKYLLQGKLAPLMGAGIGLIPQCGFSIMATNLYLAGKLSLGTLIAVFIATSDEAVPILIADGDTALKLLPMLAFKVIYAVFIGYLTDLIAKARKRKRAETEMTPQREDNNYPTENDTASAISEPLTDDNAETEKGCCGHKLEYRKTSSDGTKEKLKTYLLHPFIHSLKIFLYVFVITFLFGTLIYYVGQDKIAAFLSGSGWWQPFLTALVGLIPNCASSVIIARLYVMGGLTFGSCLAGLCSNAGIGLALLFRRNKNFAESFIVALVLYFSGVAVGLALSPLPW